MGNGMTQGDDAVIAKLTTSNAGVLITLLVLLASAIYGYSSVVSKVSALSDLVVELRGDLKVMQGNRYTSSDAVRDLTRIADQMRDHEKRIATIERCETHFGCEKMGKPG